MQYSMKLHHDRKLFLETLKAASQKLNIRLEFVERDYWITLNLIGLVLFLNLSLKSYIFYKKDKETLIYDIFAFH